MNYTVRKKLPSAEDIIESIPLSTAGYQKILQDRQEINNILKGNDKRLLMVIGPCSAWPHDAVIEYAKRLAILDKKVNHALKVVMRVYIQKPRTTKGWTGPVNQPDPFSSPDIEKGMRYARNLMVKVIEMGLPIADEALFTHNAKGFLGLLSWVAVGARSAEDQEHRIFASAINCAVGMKNPTHGSLSVAVNSVIAAQHSHIAVLDGYEIETHGNEHTHVVLRGGNGKPNYSNEHIAEVKKHMEANGVMNPAIIIDASHDNAFVNGKKDARVQPKVIMNVIQNLADRPDLKNIVKGFMVESYLKEGNQKIDIPDNVDLNGLSITDPCLGWEETQDLLLNLAGIFQPRLH